ncbi:MAG: hypothetical protein M5U31_00650 [Acidimicrobiia bacterium]|nr:hypothetical protein [Acidimicrobiia bacterium]
MATPGGRVDSEGGRENADTDGDHVDLVREEMRDRCIRLLTEAGDPTEPFGLYVLPAAVPDSELARHVERSVFAEWFGNTPEMLAEEYAAYEDASVFLCVMDHERRLPAGAMRISLPSSAGFKTLDDLKRIWEVDLPALGRKLEFVLDTDHMMDVGTMAVMPEYRGNATEGLVALSLIAGMCALWHRCGTRWMVSVMDLLALDRIQVLTNNSLQKFPGLEPRNYLDSPASIPVYVDVRREIERLQDADPFTYEIAHGRGLESTVRPPAWSVVELPGVVASGLPAASKQWETS